jgi:hypothetical protein
MSGARQLRNAEVALVQVSRDAVPEVALLLALEQTGALCGKAFLIVFEACRDT